jgi:pyruvate/2-oxoglutarate dehydrogenase complex dihydrolipoamide dehydrogenase (E3) component
MSPRIFDVIVIGAGPAREVAAGRLAAKGYEVAIVEADLVGGECSYYACMPSKALLRPAQALSEARRVPGAAEAVTGSLDVAAVLSRRDMIVGHLDDAGQLPWLESRGIELIRGRGRIEGERRVRVEGDLYEARRVVECDEVLVALGRAPLTRDLGLDSVGLRPGKFIEVDDRLRVPGLPWLYAIGDANERSLVTHVAKHRAHLVSEIIDGHDPVAIRSDQTAAPRVIFTDPQVASVGLTLKGAIEAGLDARAYDVPSSGTAGASFHGRNTPGTSRIVVDETRRVIVGATFTGSDVAEWLQAATIAIVGRVPIERLWDAVPAFPTRSEIWLKLLERRESERAAEHQPHHALAA